jgi:hypothetical protein
VTASAESDPTIAGYVDLARAVMGKCACERGWNRHTCQRAPLDRSYILDTVLNAEQRDRYERMIAAEGR